MAGRALLLNRLVLKPLSRRSLSTFFHSNNNNNDDDHNNNNNIINNNNINNNNNNVTGEISNALIGVVDEPIYPVAVLTSVLDSFHNATALPWWAVIATSTLALRVALLPVIILQQRKLKEIAEFLPKLPPPIPPPLSGRSYINQLSLFRKQRVAVGCPSLMWFLAAFTVQAPCFILGMMTFRKMSLSQHPGFDCESRTTGVFVLRSVMDVTKRILTIVHVSYLEANVVPQFFQGGAFWFLNLTEYPHGILGLVFPCLVAGLHLLNTQVAFQTFPTRKASGLLALLAEYYKVYLQVLTLPILFAALNVPQGSLVYWVTNSSSSLIQQLSFKHPSIRVKLGLPELTTQPSTKSEEVSAPELIEIPTIEEQRKIRLENLSPGELLALSIKHLAAGEKEEAIPLLRSALDKDPHYVRAIIVMGQILIQNGQLAEAVEYLESAILKLFLIGLPTEVEELDLLILASQWAGVACIKQERNEEGIRHLERVTNLKEPVDTKSKAHYYDAFVLLGSALYREGRKADAAKYLRMAVAYNPAYQQYLDECESGEDDFASDLVSTRRRDY